MKQSENNEIDTLLRNLARRGRAAQNAPDSASRDFAAQGAHLDIDELSSYAERALPPSARARCTTHLADCDDCRKIVAQLSMAAGPLTEERKIEDRAVAGLTWVEKLSTLLSPRIIRYAMPALVLVIVAVAFFGWRQQRPRGFADQVALNEQSDRAITPKAPGEPTAATNQTGRTKSDGAGIAAEREQREGKTQPTPAASEPASGRKTEDKISEEKKLGAVAGESTSAAKAAKEDSAPADKREAAKTGAAPEPAPPAAKAQSTAAANQDQKDLARNNTNIDGADRSRDMNVQQQRKGPARNDNEVTQRGPAKGQTQPASKMKDAAGGARAEDDEAETRTVFGRQFRRVSNAWVDTAYKSSMSIRSLTRGTEEYRALVDDEPVIGGIAKQLSGEVIVVWKGHAYRIN